MTSLLFVDDEANVLSGLRRMLRSCRKQWDMDFASGGQEALDRMSDRQFDVVVSDMRMPGMDGAQLLNEVMQRYPETVRMVLSGQSEQERIFRALGTAHQYLSKPCDAETLKATVGQACQLRDRLPNDDLKQLVSQVTSIPSPAAVFNQLMTELESSDPSVERVGQIISSDVGMTAKVLQLVSSSFFGQPQRVTSAQQAASLLGVELLRELSNSANIFSVFDVKGMDGFSLEELTSHSCDVAECARRIAASESDDGQLQGDACLGGLLHDVGKIVLAANVPSAYMSALKLSREKQITLWEAEMEIFGASHAEVGSYLMGLWGLPDPIVEAIAYYRKPNEVRQKGFTPLTAVHVANILKRKRITSKTDEEMLLHASEYLKYEGFADRVVAWSALSAINSTEVVS